MKKLFIFISIFILFCSTYVYAYSKDDLIERIELVEEIPGNYLILIKRYISINNFTIEDIDYIYKNIDYVYDLVKSEDYVTLSGLGYIASIKLGIKVSYKDNLIYIYNLDNSLFACLDFHIIRNTGV